MENLPCSIPHHPMHHPDASTAGTMLWIYPVKCPVLERSLTNGEVLGNTSSFLQAQGHRKAVPLLRSMTTLGWKKHQHQGKRQRASSARQCTAARDTSSVHAATGGQDQT